jgi:hypothetical protein
MPERKLAGAAESKVRAKVMPPDVTIAMVGCPLLPVSVVEALEGAAGAARRSSSGPPSAGANAVSEGVPFGASSSSTIVVDLMRLLLIAACKGRR